MEGGVGVMEKLCIGCKHFFIDFGREDWSELTPGDPPEVRCLKHHFSVEDPRDLTTEKFRKVLKTAINCQEYEWRSE